MAHLHPHGEPERARDLLGGILRRRQAASDQAERLSSDRRWQPPCDTCLREGKGLIVVEIECDSRKQQRRTPCPRRNDACIWSVHEQEYERVTALRKREQWLRQVGIGLRYWAVTEARLREGEALLRYLTHLKEQAGQGRGLILTGPVGVGKTAALALIARRAYEAGILSVCYLTASRLMTALCHSRGPAEEWGEPWRGCRLLLLDELGAAYESDFAVAQLEDLLGWRYDHKLATCVATNLSRGMLVTSPHYARLLDRWRETNTMVTLTGPSQRPRGAPSEEPTPEEAQR